MTIDNTRLVDLVRYMRAELHQADLITDDEYMELCSINGSPQRLQDYDAVRKRLAQAEERAEQFKALLKEARRQPIGPELLDRIGKLILEDL